MEIQKPKRKKHSYTQSLQGTPSQVFPLLCPVREKDWVPGWDPKLVISSSGLVEADCIFITAEERAGEAIWIVSKHDPAANQVEMYKVIPGLMVVKLEIVLSAVGEDRSQALISYERTALSEAGAVEVEGYDAQSYESFMREWEAAINHYLTRGQLIS